MAHTPEPEESEAWNPNSDEQSMAAHMRMTKCLAACAGIPTDKLRPGIVKELIEASVQLMRLHPASSGQPRRGPIVEIENGMRALLRELGSE